MLPIYWVDGIYFVQSVDKHIFLNWEFMATSVMIIDDSLQACTPPDLEQGVPGCLQVYSDMGGELNFMDPRTLWRR